MKRPPGGDSGISPCADVRSRTGVAGAAAVIPTRLWCGPHMSSGTSQHMRSFVRPLRRLHPVKDD